MGIKAAGHERQPIDDPVAVVLVAQVRAQSQQHYHHANQTQDGDQHAENAQTHRQPPARRSRGHHVSILT